MFEEEDEPKSHDAIKKMPLYIKAWGLMEHVDNINVIVQSMVKENKKTTELEMMLDTARWMSENAMIIPAKISGAEAVDIYGIRMENAAIIRKAAREIMVNCTGLKMYGFKEEDYLELVRNEVEEFRVLFAEWVKGFDVWNYVIDRWGLFNPPGIAYDDKDPDDDIPFDPSDFFDME